MSEGLSLTMLQVYYKCFLVLLILKFLVLILFVICVTCVF